MITKPIVVNIKIVTLDLEQALERYITLYQNRGVKLAKDFAVRLRGIWNNRRGEIEQAAQNLRYNTLAVVPGKVNLPEFHEQMTQGYKPTWESSNFQTGGSWAGIRSFQTEQDRIVLFHDCLKLNECPFIKSFLGQSLAQISGLSKQALTSRIAKGKPFQGHINVDGQQQIFDGWAVEDYLAIQAERYSRTKQHLDTNTYSWLFGSYCGRLVPALLWSPGTDWLYADASGSGYAGGSLAPRPAAVFV